jgi:hypothetical protein
MAPTSQPIAEHSVAGTEKEEREGEREENDVEQRGVSRNERDLFPHHVINIPLAGSPARINET